VFVLPFIEQSAVRARYNLNADWASAANKAAREAHVPVFLCPSAPGPSPRYNVSSVTAAGTDYAPDNGYGAALESAGLVDVSVDRNGILQVNKAWSIPEIRDGTSNTFLVSECAGRPDEWRAGTLAIVNGQTDGGWADDNNEYITHGMDAAGTASPGPCHTNCSNNNEVYSFHTGGANHVFADGSVRFISADMDIRLFVRLITRSGGEVAPPDF
jgi:prepilin-type processing-associated H-X9-DG protein